MYKTVSFKKKLLATLVASSALGVSSLALAQDDAEEIVVTGIKASLTRAMDIKRDAAGVVDAISAEDMGKMPDSNLAESLQRITGVSINRANGEGSRVTVRGFGPDFNLVTLNGRAMSSATFDSRSFDFGDLASEGIAGMEVFKTGRADVASGGIGATINVKTARPLDTPGFKASFGVKALNDSTNRTGDDVTPEVSGIISNSFADDTIGVALSGSYQKRDSGTSTAYVNQWNVNTMTAAGIRALPNAKIENAPAVGEKYTLPSDLRYTLGDQSRERTNGNLTLQFKPVDNFKATLDYAYSKNEWSQQRIEQSLWFTDDRSHIVFDSSPIKAPLIYSEYKADPKDISFARQVQGTTAENNAIGVNLSWDVSDDLNIAFDYSNAKSTIDPTDPRGDNLNPSVAGNVVQIQSVNFTPAFPTMFVKVNDTLHGNGNGKLDAGDMTTTMGTASYQWAEDEINQARIDATWKFDDNTLKFGLENRTNDYLGRQRNQSPYYMGDWGGADPKIVPDEFFFPRNFLDDFKGVPTEGSFTGGMDWDFEKVIAWAGQQQGKVPGFSGFPGGKFTTSDTIATYRDIQEDIQAAYVQFSMPGELGGKPFNVLAGLRYENTDVTAATKLKLPSQIRWTGDDDFQVDQSATDTAFAKDASYDHLLPSLDFSIDMSEDVKGRVSFSTTIARPNYSLMRADTSVGDYKTYQANSGNPGLLPLESKNFDASVEWYYADSSYVSLGVYRKVVDKFNSVQAVKETLFGLKDPTKGPRQQAAVQQLASKGNTNPSLQEIYNQVLANAGQTGPNGNIAPDANDPLAIWNNNKPVNNKKGTISGFEVAIQHMFGDSGFGTQVNYTTVAGDVGYDNALQGSAQFALVGLSDSANIVAFYEKDGLSARITYNWRDKFLDTTNQYNNEPGYTSAFGAFDANVSYEINENLSVSLEALNITGEDNWRYGRTETQLWNYEVLGPRYALGARYTF